MKSAFKRNSIGFFYSPNSNSHIPHSNIGFTIVELPSSLKFRRASLVPNNNVKQGFTIVELLVVIVVIGILAAITIVSYTGISGRAINSSVKSDISQAYKQLEISKTTSSTDAYPVDQASANLKSSNGTTYTYYSDSPYKSYCLVATNSSTVYSVSSSNPIPLSGNCLSNGLVLNLDAGNTASYPSPFNGTTWTDLSSNGNNGTLNNGVAYSGTNGGALVFDGVDDYVDGGNNARLNFGTSDFSATAWIYPTKNSPINNEFSFLSKAVNIVSPGWWLETSTWGLSVNQIGVACYFGKTAGYTQAGTFLTTLNGWHQITMVRNGTNVKLYNDGVYKGGADSVDLGLDKNNNDTIHIGGRIGHNNGFYGGLISDVRIYNRTLSSTEIVQNFNTLKSRYGL